MSELIKLLHSHGVIVKKGVIDRNALTMLAHEVWQEYEAKDADPRILNSDPAYRDGQIQFADHPSYAQRMHEIMQDLLANEFKDFGMYYPEFSCFRRVSPKQKSDGGEEWSNFTGWHLDAEYFDCDQKFVVNIWTPMSDGVNIVCPGMRFKQASLREVKDKTGYSRPGFFKSIFFKKKRDQFSRINRFKNYVGDILNRDCDAFGPDYVPQLNIGDICIFTNWTPHVSNGGVSFSENRLSCEYRLSFPSLQV